MAIEGIIFDIDGTLVDTNPAHIQAWRRAFARYGFDVSAGRIRIEVGKGGDLLVPSILGEELGEKHGDDLRKAQKEEFLEIAKRVRFKVCSKVPALFHALSQRGIRTALATSSDQTHLQAIMKSAGLNLTGLADELVTKSEGLSSKPAPDLLLVTLEKLDVSPSRCAMVGDTIYDGQASEAAGIAFIGVLSGCSSEKDLLEAGACGVWRDTGHIFDELDRVLERASSAAAASH